MIYPSRRYPGHNPCCSMVEGRGACDCGKPPREFRYRVTVELSIMAEDEEQAIRLAETLRFVPDHSAHVVRSVELDETA